MATVRSRLARFCLLPLLYATMAQPFPLDQRDLESLREIRRNLNDIPGSDFFSSWDFSAADPCSSFAGVVCQPDVGGGLYQRVQSLNLGTGLAGSSGLTGSLSPAVGNLTALLQLVVYPGNVSGDIPDSICNLRSLQYLEITSNRISGRIPTCLENLQSLHTIDLGYNNLHGPIPANLTSSSMGLRVLILTSNFLSGPLPNFDAQLFHIDVKKNLFTGFLPRFPVSLRYLSASQNRLSGPLTNLVPLPQLSFLDLSMNDFNGSIPTALLSYDISSLLLQRNNLSGQIPSMAQRANLAAATVDLSHNNLSGELPSGLAGVENLFLNNNRFTGPVPVEYVNNVYDGSLKTLYLQHNFLTSFPVPPGGGAGLPESGSLCISYNCMDPPVRPPCPASAGEQQSRPVNQCPAYNG
ncbi:unnamed protein product [Victoria cruziana]